MWIKNVRQMEIDRKSYSAVTCMDLVSLFRP